ncbi:hypothetical protein FF011L_47220 [Roseimaritima multifibrata]|uniref:Uncharacterized protein n=2 Tax=Roseimaritima multifibrata TaxID=1930274 RepID=A0A517MM11_9BACT|nr:hypothetical protein FF011L_47220 [Roseimaritima multifibrata]
MRVFKSFFQSCFVIVAAFGFALSPCSISRGGDWDVYNPETDDSYWNYSDISAEGQGPPGASFRVALYQGAVKIGEHNDDTEMWEGGWDHNFESPPPGWPSGNKTLKLYSRGANQQYTIEVAVPFKILVSQ